MNFVKKLVYAYGIPWLGKIKKKNNKYINVIYYHDIVRDGGKGAQYTDIEIFKQQMKYLQDKGYTTFTFNELDNKSILEYNSKNLLITFDDGWISNYVEIFDYMKSMGLKYNVFLQVGVIDRDEKYLTWKMVKEMYSSGIVGFGAHTYTHVAMDDLTNVDLSIEIEEANRIFCNNLGVRPADFCFPYGKYTIESRDTIINTSEYKRIYTSDMRYSYSIGERQIFGRNSINNDESFHIFKNKVKGYYNCLADLSQLLERIRV